MTWHGGGDDDDDDEASVGTGASESRSSFFSIPRVFNLGSRFYRVLCGQRRTDCVSLAAMAMGCLSDSDEVG